MHTNLQLVRDKFQVCQTRAKECSLKGKGIDKGLLWKYDFHALFGWMLCSSSDEPDAHVASDLSSPKGKKKKGTIKLDGGDDDESLEGVKELMESGGLGALPGAQGGGPGLPSPPPLPAVPS